MNQGNSWLIQNLDADFGFSLSLLSRFSQQTGRNGNQCLTAYCRSTSKSRAESFSEREDEELLRLIKVLGPRWNASEFPEERQNKAFNVYHLFLPDQTH